MSANAFGPLSPSFEGRWVICRDSTTSPSRSEHRQNSSLQPCTPQASHSTTPMSPLPSPPQKVTKSGGRPPRSSQLTNGLSSSLLLSPLFLAALAPPDGPLTPFLLIGLPVGGALTCGACDATSTGCESVGASTAMGCEFDMIRLREGASEEEKGREAIWTDVRGAKKRWFWLVTKERRGVYGRNI